MSKALDSFMSSCTGMEMLSRWISSSQRRRWTRILPGGPGGCPTRICQRWRLRVCRDLDIPTSYMIALQEWTLLKVFDSKMELTTSEDESEFSYATSIELDGAGTKGIMKLGCYPATCMRTCRHHAVLIKSDLTKVAPAGESTATQTW